MLAKMLDITIDIQARTLTQTATGAATYTYATKMSNVPASYREKGASLGVQFKSETAEYTYRFYIAYTTGINEKDRILYNGEKYYIDTIYNVAGKNRILQIDTHRGNNG